SAQFQPLRVVVPEYPELAFERDIQGLVRLEADVGISGKVLDVRVLESVDGGLALSASRALLLWEFQPFVVGGRPRPFRIVVPFRFRIEG
ncbi:MAG: energy transducer TonB, partial [Candidatus Eisenbacteria bacterium]|nr:energy transducer TonB [Candidatus Eisenbacteria bacterium]